MHYHKMHDDESPCMVKRKDNFCNFLMLYFLRLINHLIQIHATCLGLGTEIYIFGSGKTKDDGDGAGTSDGKDAATNSLSDVPHQRIRFQQETEASVSDGSIVIRPARDSGDSNTSDEGTSARQRSRRSTIFEQSRQCP
jgi:hypothetical protein